MRLMMIRRSTWIFRTSGHRAWVISNAVASEHACAAGFTTQAYFPIGCGIEHYLLGSEAQPTQDRTQRVRLAMMLTQPVVDGQDTRSAGLTANHEHPLCGLGSGIWPGRCSWFGTH